MPASPFSSGYVNLAAMLRSRLCYSVVSVCRLSVSLSDVYNVCIVAKRCILSKIYLKKQTGNDL